MAPASPLSVDLDDLPLVLAGPMVRRVQPDQVTVWVALKDARAVTLRVFDAAENGQVVQVGVQRTVPLGDHLHVVAVTADFVPALGPLQPGTAYFYDLFFAPRPDDAAPLSLAPPGTPGLQGAGILVTGDPAAAPLMDRLLYPQAGGAGAPGETPRFARPGFVMPPADLGKLRLMHASCRKPHGEGRDMLAQLDALIGDKIGEPLEKPQMLLLTGDQIYADDVADALLAQITEVSKTVMGWTDSLPDIPDPDDLKPGNRQDLTEDVAEFTSSDAHSHLLAFDEFCVMYLLAWSPVLWPQQDYATLAFDQFFPGEDATRTDFWGRQTRTDLKERFDGQKPRLDAFLGSLKAVRRALANISTYMIFDDHEVTDDWFLNLEWCRDVLGKTLGRRVINNGLLTYSIFQAWGNTPERFTPGAPGAALLQTAAGWRTLHATQSDVLPQFGLPSVADLEADGDLWPKAAALPGVLRFDYVVDGPPVLGGGGAQEARTYKIFFLNPRTGRKYATDDWFFDTTPPRLLGPAAFDGQLNPAPLAETEKCELAVIVAPAPVIGVPWVEHIQDVIAFFPLKAYVDYEYWGLQEEAVQTLFSRIARLGRTQGGVLSTRAVVLCGDVHYGFGARIGYGNPASIPKIEATIAQFTASSLKNQTSGGFLNLNIGKTLLVHNVGYAFWGDFLPEPDGETVKASIDAGSCYQPAFIRMKPQPPSPPAGPAPGSALEKFAGVAKKHQIYTDDWANGTEVVGYNNLGEIRVRVDAGGKPEASTQTLYWQPDETRLETTYEASFAFQNPACS